MTAIRVWAGLVAVFGLGVAFQFTGGTARPADPVLGWSLVVTAGLLAATESRLAAGLVSAVAVLVYLGPVASTMTVLIIMVSAAVALFDGDELRLVLRVQASTVYVFAGLNKLWPPFLSGDVLDEHVRLVPGETFVAAGVVATEIALGVLVLARWRWAPVVVAGLHAPMVPLVSMDPLHGVTMFTYGAMMFWLVVRSTNTMGGPDVRWRCRSGC